MAADQKQELGPRPRLFIHEYLKDFHGTRAAIAAGYEPSAAKFRASRLLADPRVKKEIEKAMSERIERLKIDGDMILQQLMRIGFSDMRKVAKWNKGSVCLHSSDDIDDETAAVITELRETDSGVSVKLGDKLQALTLLGKHIGLFTDKVEHSGPGGTALAPPVVNLTLTQAGVSVTNPEQDNSED